MTTSTSEIRDYWMARAPSVIAKDAKPYRIHLWGTFLNYLDGLQDPRANPNVALTTVLESLEVLKDKPLPVRIANPRR